MRRARTIGRRLPAATLILLVLIVLASLGPAGAVTAAGNDGPAWEKGVTSMSALSAQERSDLCGGPLDPTPPAGEKPSVEPNLKDFSGGAATTWDWRNVSGVNWMTPVTDQMCGDCWAHAACGSMEPRLRYQSGGTYGYLLPIDLSERFVVTCSPHGSCDAWNMPDTLDFMRDTGVVDEDCLPYLSTVDCDDKCSDWTHHLYKVTTHGYYDSSVFNANVKASCQYNGPIAVWMMVYSDFYDYTSGIYTVSPTATVVGGHFVNIVGWGSSGGVNYWICKNSWGTGWGMSGYFYIRMGTNESRIEEYAYWLTPQTLPNLAPATPAGWDYPLVPRSANDATAASCHLTATLPGNTAGTYLNANWTNTGAVEAPGNASHIFLDGNYIYWMSISFQPSGYNTEHTNWGPVTVPGGRHTLGFDADWDGTVWETNENDQQYYRQFVWSPLALADDTPLARSAPPIKDAWGNAASPSFNNDGFSFQVQQEHPNKWWSAVGVLAAGTGADYDVRLWDIGDYTGSNGGFGAGFLEWSSYGGNVSDFVILNDNVIPAGTYYAGAVNYNGAADSYRIEEATSEKIFPRPATEWNGPYTRAAANVLDIYECYLTAGKYRFTLDQTAGACDLGISLYDDETAQCAKSEYMAMANAGGDGGDETFVITVPDDGYHALAVWKSDASDYSKTTTYRIAVEPVVLSVQTNAATSIKAASATLNGALLDLGGAASANVYFEWGLTTAYGNTTTPQTMTADGAFSAPIAGLACGTTYHFKAVAVGGTTASGADLTFTTSPCVTARIDPPTQTRNRGQTFAVDVLVNPSTYGVSGGEVTIAFDPTILTAVDIVAGGLLGPTPLVGAKTIDNSAGTIQYALARVGATTPPTSPGVFATITFTVNAGAAAGTYPIDITAIGLADEAYHDIPGIASTDGTVTIVAYPAWDINQDGKVDYKDLALLGAHYGQTTTPPYPAWDINQDGKVDYKDLALLGAHYGETY